MSSNTDNETVIVGAGPAGLTAALVLARYRPRVVVVDSPHAPRTSASGGVHGHIGLDGAAPAEMRSRGWKELSRYATVELLEADVESVRTAGSGRFGVGLDNGDIIEACRRLTGRTQYNLDAIKKQVPDLAERARRELALKEVRDPPGWKYVAQSSS